MKLNKCQDMLLGIAIGDAFGSGYEFLNCSRQKFDFTKYMQNPNPKFATTQGMYTDDTQMSIAIAEVLLSKKEFNKENLADYFVSTFRRDKITGYAKGFQKILETIQSGQELLAKIRPDSKRNGAAMRAVPIGLEPDIDTVIKYATINAQVTHNTPKGIASSRCVALASHYLFYDKGDIKDIHDFISPYILSIDIDSAQHLRNIQFMKKEDLSILCGKENAEKGFGIPCDAMRTAGAAVYLITKYNNSSDVLKHAVLLGGDTDSVAAISLGLSAIKNGIDDLPGFLIKKLTDHKYGKNYLLNLGNELHNLYFTGHK